MIEIMEPTDFAVRFEFERGGYCLPVSDRFMGRDVDFALDMVDFRRLSHDEIRARYFGRPHVIREFGSYGSETSLVDERLTDCFRVSRVLVNREITYTSGVCQTFLALRGTGSIRSGDYALQLRPGVRGLLPASTTKVQICADEAELELIMVRR